MPSTSAQIALELVPCGTAPYGDCAVARRWRRRCVVAHLLSSVPGRAAPCAGARGCTSARSASRAPARPGRTHPRERLADPVRRPGGPSRVRARRHRRRRAPRPRASGSRGSPRRTCGRRSRDVDGARDPMPAFRGPEPSVIAEVKRTEPEQGRRWPTSRTRRSSPVRYAARRRRRDQRAHRAAALRRQPGRPAGGAGGRRHPAAAQGLHRQRLPAGRGPGRRRRPGAADRRRARPTTSCGGCTTRRASSA